MGGASIPRSLVKGYGSRLTTLRSLLLHFLKPSLHPFPPRGRRRRRRRRRPADMGEESRGAPWQHRDLCEGLALRYLVRDGDPQHYLHLLHSCFVALPSDAPPIEAASLDQRWKLEQVVERAIELVFHQKGEVRNTLCFGYRQPCPGFANSLYGRGLNGLECISPNTAVEILNTEAWTIVHSRVGDSLMLYLLCHTAIFYPLPNSCFLQLTGMPLHISVRSTKEKVHSACKFQGSGASASGSEIDSKYIARKRIFYNSRFFLNGGLPRSHILNQLKPTLVDANILHRIIFGPHEESGMYSAPCSSEHSNCRNLDHILHLLRKLISNSRHCQYSSLLNRHCPLPTTYFYSDGSNSITPFSTPGEQDEIIYFSTLEEGYTTQNEDCIIQSSDKESRLSVNPTAHARKKLCCSSRVDCNSASGFLTSIPKILKEVNYVSQIPDLVYNNAVFSNVRREGLQYAKECNTESFQNPKGNRSLNGTQSRWEPTNSFLSHSQVVAFIWAICRRVIPEGLLGSKKNWRMLRKNIFHFVGLRRYETFSLQQCIYGLDIYGFPWLSKIEANCFNLSSNSESYKISSRETNHNLDINMEAKIANLKRKYFECSKGCGKAVVARQRNAEMKAVTLPPGGVPVKSKSSDLYSMLSWCSIQEFDSQQTLSCDCMPATAKTEVPVITEGLQVQNTKKHTLEEARCVLKLCSVPSLTSTGMKIDTRYHEYLAQDIHQNMLNFKKHLLENWIFWVFNDFIVPLIQAHFYVTESENHRLNVLYFQKPVWDKIKNSALRDVLRSQYKRLSLQSVTCILKQRTLGVSQLRLLPKKSGVRLIANLRAPSKFVCDVLPLDNVASSRSQRLAKEHTFINEKDGSFTSVVRAENRKRKKSSCFHMCMDKIKDGDGYSSCHNSKFVRHFKSVNSMLRDVHHSLKFEQDSHPEHLGSSVYDYNEIYYKLLPFITNLKSIPGGIPPLFFVVCDVARAFDTIKQRTLCKLMRKFVHEDEYVVTRFSSVTPTLESVKVNHERISISANKCKSLEERVLHLAAKRANTVFIDQAFTTRLSRKEVLNILDEHIKRNIVQMDQGFFLQAVGIPQGSILSSLLCSIYYGHLERQKLASLLQIDCGNEKIDGAHTIYYRNCQSGPKVDAEKFHGGKVVSNYCFESCDVSSKTQSSCTFIKCRSSLAKEHTDEVTCYTENLREVVPRGLITAPERILFRLIDDWLFISTSRDEASYFLECMLEGFSDYNCFASNHKTAASFDTVISGKRFKRNLYRSEDGACFIKWSGLLFNCNTFEIQADYTRYSGEHIKSTLTVGKSKNEAHFLMTKMCQLMHPKCHPLLYDSNINSPATVRLNAYQAFLLCAMKFHCYCCCMVSIDSSNSEFFLNCVLKATRHMQRLLSQRMKKIAKHSLLHPVLMLRQDEMEWLGLAAFCKVLKKKQSRYRTLLHLIENKLQESKYRSLYAFPYLLYAVDERRSSMFKDIQY